MSDTDNWVATCASYTLNEFTHTRGTLTLLVSPVATEVLSKANYRPR